LAALALSFFASPLALAGGLATAAFGLLDASGDAGVVVVGVVAAAAAGVEPVVVGDAAAGFFGFFSRFGLGLFFAAAAPLVVASPSTTA
jgi:hypothetical protein